mgnify:CR=1 FL=1
MENIKYNIKVIEKMNDEYGETKMMVVDIDRLKVNGENLINKQINSGNISKILKEN